MFRYLLLILAIWIGALIVRQMLRRKRIQERQQPRPMENMVQCAHCGTHLPEKDAISAQGRYYCSEQHRKESRS